jgi:Zn-dependent protease with chaperone function
MSRALQLTGAIACALVAASPGEARISPSSLTPLVGANYQPEDRDERGLWDRLERLEEELAASDLVIRDPALNAYVRGVAARLAGPSADQLRILIVRDSQFNAGMFPNGLMLVHSGLLLRMRSEAELAGVLAHEIGHFVRLHQLRQWRSLKRRTGVASFLAVGLAIGGGATGTNTYDLINSINAAVYFGFLRYSRELEAEADAMGLRLIADARYRPLAMSEIWQNLVGEEQASAAARNRRRQSHYSLFAMHPAPEQRMLDLRESAGEFANAQGSDDGADRYQAALAPHLQSFLRDQVMLNDPGTSLHILGRLEGKLSPAVLRFYEGEIHRMRNAPGDAQRAQAAYAAAVGHEDAPPEAWRAHGYELIRNGQAEAGKAALARYLRDRPDAPDAAMVRHILEN